MPYHNTNGYTKDGDGPLQIITVNLPRVYVQYMDEEMCAYDFPSRSEVVRTAIREFIFNHVLAKKIISPEIEESDISKEMNGRVIRIA